jgi:hypothetical protein
MTGSTATNVPTCRRRARTIADSRAACTPRIAGPAKDPARRAIGDHMRARSRPYSRPNRRRSPIASRGE